jgi:hypothetical protein
MMSAKQGARHVPDGLARNGIPEDRNHRPSDDGAAHRMIPAFGPRATSTSRIVPQPTSTNSVIVSTTDDDRADHPSADNRGHGTIPPAPRGERRRAPVLRGLGNTSTHPQVTTALVCQHLTDAPTPGLVPSAERAMTVWVIMGLLVAGIVFDNWPRRAG